jgi:hypothetical membrane protein
MSIAVRQTVPSALPFSSPRAVVATVRRLARRADALSTMHLAALVLVVLVGGILASIVTTTDPLWWQLHFSQLGTFHDVSGALFNSTLKLGGVLVVVYAVRVRRDLRRLGRGAGRRGAASVAFLCLTVIGVNLALVGCVPLNSNKDLHDKVAGMMVLGFAALLITTPVLLHRLGRRLAVSTVLVFVFLFAGAWLFVTATINLALFEVIAFAAMFGWSGIFTHAVAGAATRAVEVPASEAAATSAPAHVASRRPRRPLSVRLVGSLALPPIPARAVLGRAVSGLADEHGLHASATVDPLRAHSSRPRLARLSAGRAALVGSAGAPPQPRPPVRRRRPMSVQRAARGDALGLPRRGCTASEAPAASGTSTTPDRRSPRRPAAER